MNVVKVPENGASFVEYSTRGTKITFGDDEISANLAKKERDDAVRIDVCKDYLDEVWSYRCKSICGRDIHPCKTVPGYADRKPRL